MRRIYDVVCLGENWEIIQAFETNERNYEFNLENGMLKVQPKASTTYDYTLHGKLITHLTKSIVDPSKQEPAVEEIHFFYEEQNVPSFVEYDGVKYRYVHNAYGDIISIVDSAGTIAVEYKYDAWGKLLSTTGSLAETLGMCKAEVGLPRRT